MCLALRAGGATLRRMIQPFIHTSLPGRVVFGAGSLAKAPEEVKSLGSRALVLTTPGQRAMGERVAGLLGDSTADVFAGAVMHTPTDVTEVALAALRASGADVLVSIGGGSTIGLGKALALRTDLNHLAIATTYAGSEMTPVIGQTESGVKSTQRTMKVLPETVIYDPDLTLGLPVSVSGASGLNAIAHAVEALYSRDGNPVISLMAEEGTRALAAALPRIAANPADPEARSEALYGAWLCGICLALAGMALHHKLCHTLGGSFNLPHAETHAILLPYSFAYNAPGAPQAVTALGRALGGDPVLRLWG
jgi:alcohol dehydrogenase class IV